jgi:excisionase family DNA binding protein
MAPRPPAPAAVPLESELVTVKQAAKLLSISERTAWRRIAAGDLRPIYLSIQITRIARSEVARYLAQLERDSHRRRKRRAS